MVGVAQGYDSAPDSDDDDAPYPVVPLSEPARLQRPVPWHPIIEPQDPNLRHMSTGVAWALRRLMLNESDFGWAPALLDECRCVSTWRMPRVARCVTFPR